MARYILRLRSRRLNKVRYGVAEIWRVSDDTKIHEEWSPPIGQGAAEAARILRLLEAAPDDQAEAIIKSIVAERMAAVFSRITRKLLGDKEG